MAQPPGPCQYDGRMRTVAVYLTLLLLVLVSLGAGFVASDWPRWCSREHWCAPGWPRRHGSSSSALHPTGRAPGDAAAAAGPQLP